MNIPIGRILHLIGQPFILLKLGPQICAGKYLPSIQNGSSACKNEKPMYSNWAKYDLSCINNYETCQDAVRAS